MKQEQTQSRRASAYRPTMLMILDGWGYSEQDYGNAVRAARTPTLDAIFAGHPHTLLACSGLAVGLPEGQMGNSEVGHLNIGAGRTVYQSLTRVTKSIEDGDFFENPALVAAMQNAGQDGHALHLFGLVSPGGVHSHTDHLLALVEMAKRFGLSGRIFIHAFLDGRDTPPRSAQGFLEQLEADLSRIGAGEIALISGRYYAMDRDNRWERVELAYDAMTGAGAPFAADSSAAAIAAAYARGEDDEFVKPTVILPAPVRNGDSVVFFNFRPDRARELTRAFTEPGFRFAQSDEGKTLGFDRKRWPEGLLFVTMTEYDETLTHVRVAFPPEEIRNTLGAYLSELGLRQLRIAETEKYAHVTFFFNGGVEEPNPGEDRVLIPSPKVATYDLQPQMSAPEVAARAADEIRSGKYDVVILNFANCDMVGHTGVLTAAIKAAETVDAAVGIIAQAVSEIGGVTIITADHGNAEEMEDEHGQPMTAHTTNLVPFIVAGDPHPLKSGKLADIAPTILAIMGIAKPDEMTGHDLRVL